MRNNNIVYLSDLQGITSYEEKGFKLCGKKTFEEIKDQMNKYNIKFRAKYSDRKKLTPSDKLKECMDEMLVVLKRHDVGAVISLADGEGVGIFAAPIHLPSWSAFENTEGKCVLNISSETEESREKANKTVNMVCCLLDTVEINFKRLDDLNKQISESLELINDKGEIVEEK